MSGAPESTSACPFCGGPLVRREATVPFILGTRVLVVRGVPAQACADCGEPLLAGAAVDVVTDLLEEFRAAHAEVSVVAYPGPTTQVA